jgi:hypothetical protein
MDAVTATCCSLTALEVLCCYSPAAETCAMGNPSADEPHGLWDHDPLTDLPRVHRKPASQNDVTNMVILSSL